MAATKFAAVKLALIDEGRFEREIDQDLQEVVKQLVVYVKRHKSKAIGAKAVLNVKLTVQFDGVDESDFSIKGQISKVVPSRPPVVTKAVEGEEQDGESTLFVRKSGSTEDSPLQGVLATKDGRVVDLKTGEAKGEAPKPT